MVDKQMKIEAPGLQCAEIAHGFFTRNGGVSSGLYGSLNIGLGSEDDRERVLQNRTRVATAFDVSPDHLLSPYQIHSPDVITVKAPWQEDADRKADALVTATPGLAIGVATADCGPVLFADPVASVVGAAHSGWKGAVSGILENTVAAMEAAGAQKDRICAVLGPTISQTSYEVGPEFYDRFVCEAASFAGFFRPSARDDHHLFDLPGFITAKLAALGLGHVSTLHHCTYSEEDRFFSYRRTTHRKEPDYGRQISAIMIRR